MADVPLVRPGESWAVVGVSVQGRSGLSCGEERDGDGRFLFASVSDGCRIRSGVLMVVLDASGGGVGSASLVVMGGTFFFLAWCGWAKREMEAFLLPVRTGGDTASDGFLDVDEEDGGTVLRGGFEADSYLGLMMAGRCHRDPGVVMWPWRLRKSLSTEGA